MTEEIADELVGEGLRLVDLGRTEEAIDRFDEVVARFGDASDADLRPGVALAMYDRAWAFECAGRHAEAIAVAEALDDRFGDDPSRRVARSVADGLVLKGNELTRIGLTSEALTVYDEVIARYGARTERGLREAVAMALGNKAEFVARRQRALSIPVCDEIVDRYGDATEPLLRERVAAALARKAHSLETLKRNREALAAHRQLLTRFATGESPEIDGLIAWARTRCDVLTAKPGYKLRRTLRRGLR
jgi:tetratricopeptide (TPR) repeat protein